MISQKRKPNLIETEDYFGDVDWTNKDKAKFDDSIYAENAGASNISYLLLGSKFNFSIPQLAIIREIKLHIKASATGSSSISGIFIYKNGKKYYSNTVNESFTPIAIDATQSVKTITLSDIDKEVLFLFDSRYVNTDDFKIGFYIVHANTSDVDLDYIETEILYGDFYKSNHEADTISEVSLSGFSPVHSWTNLSNVIDGDDSTYAHVEKDSSGDHYSHYIKLTDFDFNIPLNAVITGIQFEIKKAVSFSTGTSSNKYVDDLTLRIVKDNQIVGTERGKVGTNYGPAILSITPVVFTHGGEYDLWDEVWSPEDINDVNFGIQFATRLRGGSTLSIARIYYVKATVFFTFNGTVYSETKVASNVTSEASLFANPENAVEDDDDYSVLNANATNVLDTLLFNDFGFEIPENATILGFDVKMKVKSDFYDENNISKFFMFSDLAIVNLSTSEVKFNPAFDQTKLSTVHGQIRTTEEEKRYGANAINILNNLTPVEANSEDLTLGLAFMAFSDSGEINGSVDYVEMTIHYVVGTANNLFSKNKRGQIKMGFEDELIQLFSGKSGYPEISVKQNNVKYHFFDELFSLSEFKLSDGQLQLNIRTDRYIWEMLDEVYKDYFDTLFTFDTDESWDSDGVSEETEFRIGDAGIKLSSVTGSVVSTAWTRSSPFTHDIYGSLDWVEFFLYVEDPEKLLDVQVRLRTDSSNYFAIFIDKNGVSQGWNHIKLQLKDIQSVGSPTFANITSAFVQLRGETGQNVYVIIDEIRLHKNRLYPRRFFDVGLQNIPVAWWSGNTVLYEIKTAAEAEGARFYADENGDFHFENRQFYNTHDEYKLTRWSFDFNNLTDFEYTGRDSDIINSVVIRMKPRKVVSSAEEIWVYPFTTQIPAGETKEIWAPFTDPVPATTSGIITPVATTDYTANDAEDGSGTDKTSNLSISVTRFVKAAKLELTNTDSNPIYVTFLRLRGTPAKEQNEVEIRLSDTDSISKYNVSPEGGYLVENKYLVDESYARIIAQQIIDWYKNPVKKIELKGRAVPQLQIGDLISVYNNAVQSYYIMRVIRLKYYKNKSGFNMSILSREIGAFETLSYFTIGESAIEGTDVIST